jgi:hypothetical protein
LLCRGSHTKVATLAAARIPGKHDQGAALPAVREAAAETGIGLTPHEKVIQRAFAALGIVNQTFAEMQRSGDLKSLNSDFKNARLPAMFGVFTRISLC